VTTTQDTPQPQLPILEANGRRRGKLRTTLVQRSRLYFILLLLMLPTLATMILFNYYPNYDAFKFAFYRWDGGAIEEFQGLKNFKDIWNDGVFWSSFQLVFILLAANLVKMVPSILTAVTIHRVRSERWQFLYRVIFVVPMVIPWLVVLLIWKSFYQPDNGILNAFLNGTGLMKVLAWLDVAMPATAYWLQTYPRRYFFDPVFANPWGTILVGSMILLIRPGIRSISRRWLGWTLVLFVAMWAWMSGPLAPDGILKGLAWTGELWRLPLFFAVTAGFAHLFKSLRKDAEAYEESRVVWWTGMAVITTGVLLVLLTLIWTEPVKAFATQTGDAPNPAWLGHSKLIIPAVIFYGFPWIGTVGVLIYLAGLQTISQDVYEAAELDGIGPLGKLFRIELPLLMTQVRINLIFMTMGTFQQFILFFVLLDPNGGAGGKGMVPGLYMYRTAFYENRYGYACALGLVLFFIILAITIIYQKYVKVEK
jgi:ABC-type sugar transport system permease subunit